jgi:hypothetical protein
VYGSDPLFPGASRARVVIVEDSQAVQAFRPNPDRVRALVDRGVTALTQKSNVKDAWRSLVSREDVVGLKAYSVPGAISGTRPAVVAGVIEGLLEAGLPATNIIVWDRHAITLRQANFYELAEKYGVQVRSSMDEGYDETRFYNESPVIGTLVWGDLEFGRKEPGVGRKSFVSKLLTKKLTKIINISPMLNHNLAGVSGNLFSLVTGSVDNLARFEFHPGQMASAFPEIYALEDLSDKVVLSIVDALVCQYEGGQRGLLHHSATLNELRFSKDPVALDVLSIRELESQREKSQAPPVKPNMDLYSTAALLQLGVDDPDRIKVERLDLTAAN